MQKNRKISMLLMLVILTTIMMPVNAYALNKDYEGHWAESTIQSWLDNKLISGYPDGSFKPNAPVTRAEFVKMANNLLGYTEIAPISFSDVNINSWYYIEVQKAFKAGYISGVSDLLFSPNTNLTREQAAVIVSKILGLELNTENVQQFTDNHLISDWAKNYVDAATVAQIILGYTEDNTFRPQNPITRAEAIVLLDRLNQFEIEDITVPEGTITPPPITGGGGGGGGGGPIIPTPSTISMSVKNQIIMIGIEEEYNLADNITLETSDVALTYTITYTITNENVVTNDSEGMIKGNKQGKVTVTIKASKTGYENKTVSFGVIVAPVSITWTQPSEDITIGKKQDININIKLYQGANKLDNVNLIMLWEKKENSNWVPVNQEDITITYNTKLIEMNKGIYQLIKGLTVDNTDKTITTEILFNNAGEYKLTVYCIKE